MPRKVIIFALITLFYSVSFAQDNIFRDKVYKESIKTVLLHPAGDVLGYPVMPLNNGNLVLEFDDLNSNNKIFDYQYTIVHCKPDWTPSDLLYSDYIDGFEENNIDDYSASFNTLVPYTHFSLQIPNDDVKFKLSGNYVLIVYKNYDPEDTVLTMRFVVTENNASISGQVLRPTIVDKMQEYQQVNFSVTSPLFTNNNYRYLKVLLVQNGDFDYAQTSTPYSYNQNTAVFNNPFENLFPAGNEFHYFDCQEVRRVTERVGKITLEKIYNFYLLPEKRYTKYFYYKDINGKYVINNYLGTNPSVDADYVKVHFYLVADIIPQDVYIVGDFNLNSLDDSCMMDYDAEHQLYKKTLLLKQGFYNYRYFGSESGFLDGNFYETKNDYLIIVYFYDQSMDYYRVLSVKTISN